MQPNLLFIPITNPAYRFFRVNSRIVKFNVGRVCLRIMLRLLSIMRVNIRADMLSRLHGGCIDPSLVEDVDKIGIDKVEIAMMDAWRQLDNVDAGAQMDTSEESIGGTSEGVEPMDTSEDAPVTGDSIPGYGVPEPCIFASPDPSLFVDKDQEEIGLDLGGTEEGTVCKDTQCGTECKDTQHKPACPWMRGRMPRINPSSVISKT